MINVGRIRHHGGEHVVKEIALHHGDQVIERIWGWDSGVPAKGTLLVD